jgi:hypothetical protein
MMGSGILSSQEAQVVESLPRATAGEMLLRRIRFVCAIGVAAAIFWHVGWRVVKPFDPTGPVSLLMVDQGVIAMAQLLGLAVISSGLAVAICGRGSADRGPLAIAVGLATLGLRGSQLDTLVMYRMFPPATVRLPVDPFPTTALMAECWLWLALIAVGFVVGHWVDSWFGPPLDRRAVAQNAPSRRTTGERSADVGYGVGAVIVASLAAWASLSFTMDSDREPILKGQMYFAIGVSFLVAGLIAHGFFKTGSRMWSLVLVAVVASVAYVLGAPSAKSIEHARATGTYLNLSPLARPLPLEYAALGALGALWERDWMQLLRSLFGLSTDDRA